MIIIVSITAGGIGFEFENKPIVQTKPYRPRIQTRDCEYGRIRIIEDLDRNGVPVVIHRNNQSLAPVPIQIPPWLSN